MSTASERQPFVANRFVADLKEGCASLEAAFSEHVVKDVIDAYGDYIYDAALQLRAGSRPGSAIMFRLLFAMPVDSLDVSLQRGWLDEDNIMVRLHKSLKQQFPASIDEPEFRADTGCDAMFHYLGLSKLDKVLETPLMTDAVRANKHQFHQLHLDDVLIVHNHYREKTVSLYFLAKGPLTKEALNKYVAMAGVPEPSDSVYKDLVGVLLDQSYYVTAVMDFETGKVLRVEFHLMFPVKLPDDMEIPDVGDRLASFWDIPSYEIEDMDILSYCFGDCPNGQILAFRSHCGGLRGIMQNWGIVGV